MMAVSVDVVTSRYGGGGRLPSPSVTCCSKVGINETYDGHHGPVTGIDCHRVPGQIDFSPYFLTSSFDRTVKLWSVKVSGVITLWSVKVSGVIKLWSVKVSGVIKLWSVKVSGVITLWSVKVSGVITAGNGLPSLPTCSLRWAVGMFCACGWRGGVVCVMSVWCLSISTHWCGCVNGWCCSPAWCHGACPLCCRQEQKQLCSFEDNNGDYVTDVQWSPTNPALFSSVDIRGSLDIWHLNHDTEVPFCLRVVHLSVCPSIQTLSQE